MPLGLTDIQFASLLLMMGGAGLSLFGGIVFILAK